jgi:hypothetical protein
MIPTTQNIIDLPLLFLATSMLVPLIRCYDIPPLEKSKRKHQGHYSLYTITIDMVYPVEEGFNRTS